MNRKFYFLFFAILFSTLSSFAQIVVKGVVIDNDTKEALIGVNIIDPVTKQGTTTDLDGSFSLKLSSATAKLDITYIGYVSQQVDAKANMGTIELKSDAVGLQDVVITSTIGVDRKTPVAMSAITAEEIQLTLGTREFPEILQSTPGVYATKQGGAFGDARINIRGFESENVAVMINGVPVNDMEWGGVYWSNWAGLSDVTRLMQVQRGLGASKVAAPSVGGSMNIVTKSTDAQKGGMVFYGMGNDGYNKIGFSTSTGLTKEGWAFTLLGSKTWGDGYIQSTQFESYSYYVNISKVINGDHQLSLTGFGAPQWHNQRKDQLLISEWALQPQGERFQYNAGYGYDDSGQHKTFNRNTYHKPQVSLNHIWQIESKASLSTAAYVSIGSGGGYSGLGRNRTDAYGSSNGKINGLDLINRRPITGEIGTNLRRLDGTVDFGAMMRANANDPNGSLLAIQNAVNNHIWTGVLSTYSKDINNNWQLQGGLDLRYYKGIHRNEVADLLGGGFLVDPQRVIDGKNKTDLGWVNEKLTVGDVVYRDYDGVIMQEGVFGQAEYKKDKLSAFTAASVNVNNYWRVERFTAENERSRTVNKLGFGVKGGANYNLTNIHNVFANVGYFSRAPFFSGGVFLNAQRGNQINNDGKNEKIFSTELGYGLRTRYVNANVNIYRTNWSDKTLVKNIDNNDPEKGAINLSGVDALHQGLEMEVTVLPLKTLELKFMASFGNWKWKNNATGFVYNADGNAVDAKGNVVNAGSAEHASATLNLEGIHVGNSAQTTMAMIAQYEIYKNIRVGTTYNYFGRNFSQYKIDISKFNSVQEFSQPWQIPDAHRWDVNFNYRFEIGTLRASLIANVDNILDATYIADAADGGSGTWQDAQVYYGFGRTWSIGMKVQF